MMSEHQQISVSINSLMERSGVKFGTSGARGLADAMTDEVCYAYTLGFLGYLKECGEVEQGTQVAIAGDLRFSTPRIMQAVVAATVDMGCVPVNCGFIPTPAVALYGMSRGIPSIMVTGSHIPDDRNGIKFNKASGEILKPDEEAIRAQIVVLQGELFDQDGSRTGQMFLPEVEPLAADEYVRRYLDFYPSDSLKGRRIGLYQHSGVARDLLADILEGLGAEVVRLGRSEVFIPVDTEAVRPEDVELAAKWSWQEGLDALVSTDGDADRPLVSDEKGKWLRGDIVGILCARHLAIKTVATPVSSNSAVEKSGWFDAVKRTRIGSPYVIAAMQQALDAGAVGVAGYEANGGFLLADGISGAQGILAPLPTRDAVIVILAVLIEAGEGPISDLLKQLPARYTCSDRIKDFPGEISGARLAQLNTGSMETDSAAYTALFGEEFGRVASIDWTDGVRITLETEDVVHLRPSGNAPELRCYTESATFARAEQINRSCIRIMSRWRNG